MPEPVNKRNSFLVAACCLVPGAYCIQFALIPQTTLTWMYLVALGVLIFVSAMNYNGTIFSGVDLEPMNKLVMTLFWGSLMALMVLYPITNGGDALVPDARPAHFVIGILLFVYFALSFFGSFFSGFGTYLFLRNPVMWARVFVFRHPDWTDILEPPPSSSDTDQDRTQK